MFLSPYSLFSDVLIDVLICLLTRSVITLSVGGRALVGGISLPRPH